jgi:hypothetical protein
MANVRGQPRPFLTQPWDGGVTGWLVVFGALVAELIGGIVTNAMPTAIAASVLGFPAAVAAGFAVAQWLQVRSYGAEPASWWHLVGIGAAVIVWLAWPTSPGVLYGTDSARQACDILLARPTPAPECLVRATQAMDSGNLVWWLTGALILAAALLARRSRIAAWGAIPVALGGCLLATHFLELLLLHYQPGS